MIELDVARFGCITKATLRLNRLTLLIGPQASGKSLLSKLSYFCLNLMRQQLVAIEDGADYAAFCDSIKSSFKEWFTPSAWGHRSFSIDLKAGPYKVSLYRKNTKSENVTVTFSEFARSLYEETFEAHTKAKEKVAGTGSSTDAMFSQYYWRTEARINTILRKSLGVDYVAYQLFIPAGRSFFTSIGKAVTALEHGRFLDPVTTQFGRLFLNFRERRSFPLDRGFPKGWSDLLGGELRRERESQYVETKDGRKIPFSSLSSGHQELLPLLVGLWAVTPQRHPTIEPRLVYIEEPEAHLFPLAQGRLVDLLSSIAMGRRDGVRMLITTHSPYVLAKVNNLILAGQVGRTKDQAVREKVAKIVPESSWIRGSSLQAYAIREGQLETILGADDGLVDASYLDSVSGDIANEFNHLMDIRRGRNEPKKLSVHQAG